MPTAFRSEPAMMDWLDRYAFAADHCQVRGIDYPAVIAALEAAGYSRSDATHLPPEEYKKPDIMARYVAGQAIDCMCRGLPPHQITHKFVEQYRAGREKAANDQSAEALSLAQQVNATFRECLYGSEELSGN